MVDMEPVLAPLMSQICLALRDLIRVMGKDIIDTAAVEIEGFAEVLDADARTLNVPSRVSDAPRTIPFQLLVLKFGFRKPEDKIGLVPLIRIFLHVLPDAHLQFLFFLGRQHVIIMKL